jgi:hypothetical protein
MSITVGTVNINVHGAARAGGISGASRDEAEIGQP